MKMLFYTQCWACAYGAGLADFLSSEPRWLVDFFSQASPLIRMNMVLPYSPRDYGNYSEISGLC